MSSAIDALLSILDLEPLEHNLFRGRSPQVGWQRVFGGQVIGQALVAAPRTVEPARTSHSLHGYFLRPGDPTVPIIYEVDRIRDGGSFTTRRVVAIQHGQAIFSMSASFQVDEAGLDHQFADAATCRRPRTCRRSANCKAQFVRQRARGGQALLGARAADRDAAGDLQHYISREHAGAGAARLDPHDRPAAGRSAHPPLRARLCSPT